MCVFTLIYNVTWRGVLYINTSNIHDVLLRACISLRTSHVMHLLLYMLKQMMRVMLTSSTNAQWYREKQYNWIRLCKTKRRKHDAEYFNIWNLQSRCYEKTFPTQVLAMALYVWQLDGYGLLYQCIHAGLRLVAFDSQVVICQCHVLKQDFRWRALSLNNTKRINTKRIHV